MPQDVPGWPEDDWAAFPAAFIEIDLGNGLQRYPLVLFDVQRQLTTQLPRQIRAVSGISAATGNANLAPIEHDADHDPKRLVPATYPGHWSPFRDIVPLHVGERFRASAGLVTAEGEQTPTLLVGEIADEDGTTADPELQLQLVDDSALLQQDFDIPAIVADSMTTDAGDRQYSPGFCPLWVVNYLFSSAGFDVLLPRQPGVKFAASMICSAQPEVTGNVSQGTTYPFGESDEPYTASNFDRDGAAEFAPSGFAPSAAVDLWSSYDMTGAIDANQGLSTFGLGILFYIDWDTAASDDVGWKISVSAASGGPGFLVPWVYTIRIDADTREVFVSGDPSITDRASMTVSRTVESGLIEIYPQVDLSGLTFDVHHTICDSASCATLVESGIGVGPEGTDFDVREVQVRTTSTATGGVQVVNMPETTPSPPAPTGLSDVEPTAQLDPSLNDAIATPVVGVANGWAILNDIAAAELGAVFFTETGMARFANRETLAGVGLPAKQVVAPQRFAELRWRASVSGVYRCVFVPWVGQGVDNSGLQVWSAREQVMLAPGNFRDFTVSLDTPTVGISIDFSANTMEDGSGSDVSGDIVTSNIQQVDATTVSFRLTNSGTDSAWFVDTDGRPDLHVVAHVAIVAGETVNATADASETARSDLQVSQNAWLQTQEAAFDIAEFLATQVTQPLPFLPLARGKPDTRDQLADIVEIIDPVNTALRSRAVIEGYTVRVSAGDASHSLQLRLLLPTWGDFDAAWKDVESSNATIRDTETATSLGTDLTITAPTSEEGDRLIAIVNVRALTTITPTSGWSEFNHYDTVSDTSNNIRTFVFVKTATSSEPASYTFTGAAADEDMSGAVFAVRDVNSELGPQVYVARQLGGTNATVLPSGPFFPPTPGDKAIRWVTGVVDTIVVLEADWIFEDGPSLFDRPTLQTNSGGGSLGIAGDHVTTNAGQAQLYPGAVVEIEDTSDVREECHPGLGVTVLVDAAQNSWLDFNAAWAGRTWDDFDDDPVMVG